MMELGTWSPSDRDQKPSLSELLLSFDQGRPTRILVLPALFDEANKLRRLTVGVMRALDEAGIDSALPDLPGCNESLAPLGEQSLARWQADAAAAAAQFRATHTLAIRAGALLVPDGLPGWLYAPLEGPKLLAGLLRAQVIAASEAGRNDTREGLIARGRDTGLSLGGWEFGARMLAELEAARVEPLPDQHIVEQSLLGGPGLWLRAEPDDDADQAAALARIIAEGVSAPSEPSQ